MTQWERDQAVLTPLIEELSAAMVSLPHLEYVIATLATHYIPEPVSRVNLIGIYGTLAQCAAQFHHTHLADRGKPR